MLSVKKNTSLVELDLEKGTIAATEVQSHNGREVGRTAIVPLEPGVVREGDIQNVDALADALKDAFSRHKLGRAVRLGIANQRVVVRMLELPLIEEPKELDS